MQPQRLQKVLSGTARKQSTSELWYLDHSVTERAFDTFPSYRRYPLEFMKADSVADLAIFEFELQIHTKSTVVTSTLEPFPTYRVLAYWSRAWPYSILFQSNIIRRLDLGHLTRVNYVHILFCAASPRHSLPSICTPCSNRYQKELSWSKSTSRTTRLAIHWKSFWFTGTGGYFTMDLT